MKNSSRVNEVPRPLAHRDDVDTADTTDAIDSSSDTAFVPTLVRWIVALVLAAIPVRILRLGYRPVLDDPLADAAKAVSGREWPDILVLKDEFRFDPHIGWHSVLHWASQLARWGPAELVVFSMFILFVLVAWSALPWLKRPEAWLATMIAVVGLGTGFMERYMLGRPFLISAAVLVTILWQWQRRPAEPPSAKVIAGMTAAIGFAVLLHGSWYLWSLPVAAFILAGEYTWARAVAISWLAGTVGGALLTGHPVEYLVESVRMGFEAFGQHLYQGTLVHEFRPIADNAAGLLLVAGLFMFRKWSGIETRSLRWNPAFCLGCLGLVLGYKAMRFWGDWGIVALMVVIAADIQLFMEKRIPDHALNRVALSLGLAGTLYLMTTNDADSRWTTSLSTHYLAQDDPDAANWLPDTNGIFYSAEMGLFYQTFYRNPDARFRYITGFEPAMMPDADFAVYQSIELNHGNPQAYLPWIRKMRPADRVALHWPEQPRIPGLEWKNVAGVWLGRLPVR